MVTPVQKRRNYRLIAGIVLAVLVGIAIGLLVTQRAKACGVENVEHVKNPTYLEATYETRSMDEQIQCKSGY